MSNIDFLDADVIQLLSKAKKLSHEGCKNFQKRTFGSRLMTMTKGNRKTVGLKITVLT